MELVRSGKMPGVKWLTLLQLLLSACATFPHFYTAAFGTDEVLCLELGNIWQGYMEDVTYN
jgi:hypothetical protein